MNIDRSYLDERREIKRAMIHKKRLGVQHQASFEYGTLGMSIV